MHCGQDVVVLLNFPIRWADMEELINWVACRAFHWDKCRWRVYLGGCLGMPYGEPLIPLLGGKKVAQKAFFEVN